MGLLNHLKKTLNLGGAQMLVALDDEVHSQGDTIRGRLVLRAGDYPVDAQRVDLDLREFWPEVYYIDDEMQYHTVAETRLTCGWDSVSIRESEDTVLPFEFRLPPDARWSTSDAGWDLYVRVDVPNAVDPTGSLALQVNPGRQLLAVVDTIERDLRFEEQPRHRRWDDGTTTFRFAPPQLLRSELDYLVVDLRQDERGGASGRLVFDLQEKSIADYFRAIMDADKVQTALVLEANDIVDSHGHPQPGLGSTLARHLQAALGSRSQ